MTNFNQRLLRVVFEVMRPFARLLLNAGVSYKQFADVARLAFVDVAIRDYGLRGRETNLSRVSVMTGIGRRQVAELRTRVQTALQGKIEVGVAPSDILHFWQQDPEYVGDDGLPLTLPFEGADPSFSALVKRYGGDIPTGAMRAELKRVKAIHETEEGRLSLVKPYFVPGDVQERLLVSLTHNVKCLLATVAYNSDVPRRGPGRIERFVYTDQLTDKQVERLRYSIRDSVERYTKEVDEDFAKLEALNRSKGRTPCGRNVGVGVFFFEDDRYSN